MNNRGVFSHTIVLPIDIHKDRHVIVIDMGSQATRVDAYNQDLWRCYHGTISNDGLIKHRKKKGPRIDTNEFIKHINLIVEQVQKIRNCYDDKEIPICMVATEIIRVLPQDAQDHIQDVISRKLGAPLRILTGHEEIEYYAKAVRIFWPHAQGQIMHLGHGSLDIAGLDDNGEIENSKTLPYGVFQPAENLDDVFQDVQSINALRIYCCGKVMRELARFAKPTDASLAMQGTEKSFVISPHEFLACYARESQNQRIPNEMKYAHKVLRMLVDHHPGLRHLFFIARGMREALAYELFQRHWGFTPNPSAVYRPQIQTPVTDAHHHISGQ